MSSTNSLRHRSQSGSLELADGAAELVTGKKRRGDTCSDTLRKDMNGMIEPSDIFVQVS